MRPPIDDSDALHRLPPKVLVKAAGEGRIRGIALAAWAEARREPTRAGRVLREGIREARALHSRERRLVREALYGLIRGHRRWAWQLGTDDPLVLWLAQLVEAGLPTTVARDEKVAPYEHLSELDGHTLDPVERLSVWHGVEQGVVEELVAHRGLDAATAFLQASDQRAPVTLRTNRAWGSRGALAEALRREGIQTVPGSLTDTALHVEGRGNLQGSRAFQRGAFEVQDEGSQCMADLVPDVRRVWDVCAGAGGKALALATRGMEVLATDVRAGALAEARRRAKRAGVRIRTEAIDGDAMPRWSTPPDAVLVDAPCSGLGVLRRHPEHRWLVDAARVAELVELQGRILDQCASSVPDGGILVYGTCSVLPRENDGVIDAFLERHPDFRRDGDAMRLSPDEHGTDGFFAQRLSRSHPLH